MAVLKKDTCYHGNAGIASAFAALAHKKLKPGGVLALVLALSAGCGFMAGFPGNDRHDRDIPDVTI